MRDNLIGLILDMNNFITKNGKSAELKNKVINSINSFIGNNELKAIFVNDLDNDFLPDIFVMPIFNNDIAKYLLINSEENVIGLYNYGYTIEIHKRCFTKFTAEEIVAMIIHDILQNVQSTMAKSRFLSAYVEAMNKYSDDQILRVFDEVSQSEIMYLILIDICMRPFKVPIMSDDIVSTDDVIKNFGLETYYDSALAKILPMSIKSIPEMIDDEIKSDVRTAKTVLKACFNDEIKIYYKIFKENSPLITIDNTMDSSSGINLGFVSRGTNPNEKLKPTVVNEAIFKADSQLELDFQYDKIISSMKYIENEDERSSLLWRIKQLKLKVTVIKTELEERLERKPNELRTISPKIHFLNNLLENLDKARVTIRDADVKPKRYGVFMEYPSGYDY